MSGRAGDEGLDALFGDPAERAELRAGLGEAERAELAEVEELLVAARRELGRADDWSPLREGALVGRVLARTTREDLSWRGDLALVVSFVRDRLASSPALRVVAASLLVHLLALPVVGWYLLREPPRRPLITFAPADRGDRDALDDEAFDEELGEPAEDAADPFAGRLAERVENARRRERYLLSSASGPPIVAGPADPLEIRLLAARTRGLDEGEWEAWLDDSGRFQAADRLERALWIEVLLDRNVLSGERSALLGPALNALAQAERAHASAADSDLDPGDSLGRLERRTLARARAMGLWEAPAGFDPLATPLVLDAAWLELLEAAGSGRIPAAALDALSARARRGA